jgi:hypothetical protein
MDHAWPFMKMPAALGRRLDAHLHLDPVRRPPAAIWPIAPLRHQTLQPHIAGGAKEIRPDLALFERRHEDPVRAARQETGEVGLSPSCLISWIHSGPAGTFVPRVGMHGSNVRWGHAL